MSGILNAMFFGSGQSVYLANHSIIASVGATSIGQCTTSISLNSDGTAVGTAILTVGGTGAYTYGAGTYVNQWAPGGGASAYDVYVSYTGDAPTAGSSSVNSWLNLGASRLWQVNSIIVDKTSALTVQIARVGAHSTILSSSTVYLSSQASNSGGGAGAGGGSVAAMSFMPGIFKRAVEMQFGDYLLLLNGTRNGVKDGVVSGTRTSLQNLVTLVSKSGIRLTCSDNTPLTLEDGSSINSTEAKGYRLPVSDTAGFRWEEIVDVLDAGKGPVVTISCDDQCYAAGDVPDRWIWTHNAVLVKY
jgi:hypothetical protein